LSSRPSSKVPHNLCRPVLSAIQNLLRVEVAMRLKKLSTAIGAEFRIAAQQMRTKGLDTRQMSVRLLTQMPIHQGNSTG